MAIGGLFCRDCSAVISTQSRTGRCRPCAMRAVALDPECRARRGAAFSARHRADPAYKARTQRQVHVANLKAWRHPEKSVRMLAALMEARKQLARPDVQEKWLAGRAAAGRKRHDTVMAWCPPEYRAEYKHLRLTKKMLAADAKATILAKLTPFERAMQKVRVGVGITDRARLEVAR